MNDVFRYQCALVVITCNGRALTPAKISLHEGMVERVARAVFHFLVSVVVVANAGRVERFSVRSLGHAQDDAPLLLAYLITIRSVQGTGFVLLRRVANAGRAFCVREFGTVNCPYYLWLGG